MPVKSSPALYLALALLFLSLNVSSADRVLIPAGKFLMGCSINDSPCNKD